MKRILSVLNWVWILSFLSGMLSPFIWIWIGWGIAWKVCLTGLILGYISRFYITEIKKEINEFESKKSVNENEPSNKKSKFLQRLEDMTQQQNN